MTEQLDKVQKHLNNVLCQRQTKMIHYLLQQASTSFIRRRTPPGQRIEPTWFVKMTFYV